MHRTLVDAPTLAKQIGSPKLCILDCRHDLGDFSAGRTAYLAGHIPGAAFADGEQTLSGPKSPTTGRHPLPDPDALVAFLRAAGVNDDTQVVAYDAGGGAFASRAWWLLRWLGHDAVAVLDGGFKAWLESGGAVETTEPSPAPGNFTRREPLVAALTTDNIVANLKSQSFLLVDARTPERYRGESEPIDPVAGHVPGAVVRPWQSNLGADGRFKSPAQLRDELQALMKEHGSRPARVAHMCGSGVTACHNVLAMAIAGFDDAPALYAGSWSEWIRDPARPIARG